MRVRGFTYRTRGADEEQASPLELFYDLVFVFAVTQVSELLLDDLSWAGAGEALLALLVVWWAWDYTTWVTSEVHPDPVPVRLLLLAIALASLSMAVAVPEAFGRYGLLFACSYIAIKIGRLAFLLFHTSDVGTIRTGRAGRLVIWFLASGGLWIAGGVVEDPARTTLWVVALAIDLTGPLVMYWIPGRPRLPYDAWTVKRSHLAGRFELFIIIALGETIVLTGATTSQLDIDTARFVAFALAFLGTAALWWLYFDDFPAISRQRLELAPDGVKLARDAYMYLHVVLVAGVILSAVGDELVIARPTDVLPDGEVAIVAGGPALYLLGHVLFRLRMIGTIRWMRLGGAGACVVAGFVGTVVPALVLAALLVALLVALIAIERVAGELAPAAGAPA